MQTRNRLSYLPITNHEQPFDSIEASTLGLPVGTWPLSVALNGVVYLRTAIEHDREGDVTCARFAAASGQRLTVWND